MAIGHMISNNYYLMSIINIIVHSTNSIELYKACGMMVCKQRRKVICIVSIPTCNMIVVIEYMSCLVSRTVAERLKQNDVIQICALYTSCCVVL